MAVDPSTLNDAARVRTLMNNAERQGASELVQRCRKRLFELAGVNVDDPLERRLWEAVAAYEEVLRRKHGRNQKAGYTRRKIAERGAVATLTDWANATKDTPGFTALVEEGLAEFTGEYVVLQYADRFDPAVVDAARSRLVDAGVDVSRIKQDV